MTPETETDSLDTERNGGDDSDATTTVPLRQVNQVQATGDEDAAEEVVPEEAFTKDVAKEADASTTQHTHHRSVTLSRGQGNS